MKLRQRRRIRLGQGLLHRWVPMLHGWIIDLDKRGDFQAYESFRCRLCGKTRWVP